MTKSDTYSRLSTANAEVKALEKQLNNEDVCITCGQVVTHLYEELNTKIKGQIKVREGAIEKWKEQFSDSLSATKTMSSILLAQKARKDFKVYAIDENILPWTLRWKEPLPIPPSSEAFSEAQAWIKSAERQERRVMKAVTDTSVITEDMTENGKKTHKLQQEFDQMFVQDGSDLKEIINALIKAHDEVAVTHKDLTKDIQESQREADKLINDAKVLEKEIGDLTGKVLELNKKLRRDAHNGQILKQVRRARPIIVNKIWATVLAAVSGTFSELRQQECVVSKTEKGFAVDGLPVHRLSGSEKSILGIALRVSLRNIFAPSAGFLILDEVAADCDEERTAVVTAAIASVQGQTISITHEGISSLSCDNLIDLSE